MSSLEPGPSAAPPRDLYKWRLVAILWIAFFLHQGDRQIYNAVLPLIRDGLGLTDVQMGLVATVFTAVYGVCVPLAGLAGDILRRKWIVIVSLLVFSAGTLCTGLGGGLIGLILFRSVATGGGEAFYYPAATSLLGQFHGKSRATALAIHQTALYIGITVSGLAAGWIGQTFGWRPAFFTFGFAGIAWALVAALALRDTPQPAAEGAARAERIPIGEVLRRVAGKRSALMLWLAFGAMVYVNVAHMTWMPTYLHEKFDLSLANAGFSSMFYHYAAAFVGVLIGGRLTDRLAARRRTVRFEANALGLLAGAPFILWMARADQPWACYAALAGYGLFRGIYDSNLFASLFDVIEPRLRASATGLMLSFAFVVGACSPVVLGWMKTRVGLSAGLASLSAFYVAGGLCIVAALALWFRRDYVEEKK